MNFEKSFVAARSGVRVVPLIRRFLQQAGYKRVSDKPVVYERGSLLGTWTSFTPSKWFARATVSTRLVGVDHTEVVLKLYVNASGQAVTPAERGYFESELETFERAVETGEAEGSLLLEEAESVGSTGRWTVIHYLIGAVVLTVLGALLRLLFRQL